MKTLRSKDVEIPQFQPSKFDQGGIPKSRKLYSYAPKGANLTGRTTLAKDFPESLDFQWVLPGDDVACFDAAGGSRRAGHYRRAAAFLRRTGGHRRFARRFGSGACQQLNRFVNELKGRIMRPFSLFSMKCPCSFGVCAVIGCCFSWADCVTIELTF